MRPADPAPEDTLSVAIVPPAVSNDADTTREADLNEYIDNIEEVDAVQTKTSEPSAIDTSDAVTPTTGYASGI